MSRWTLIGGEPGATYRYLGADATRDLNAQNYADTSLWAKLGGTPDTTYQFVGSALDAGSIDINAQDYADTSLWAPFTRTPGAAIVTAVGEVSVTASDSGAIFANVKVVSSSSTTNDGGASVAQKEANNFIPADFLSSEGERTLAFGDRVRIAAISEDHASSDGEVDIANGETVRVEDGYADARFTTDSGKRIVLTGDTVEVQTGYAGGGTAGQVYRYLGLNKRLDLGAQDYSDTDLWAPIAGESGRLYEYIGTAAQGMGRDLSLQDYTDTALWTPLGGDEGIVYQWMGPTGTTIDLTAPIDPVSGDPIPYDNLDWWKPVLGTSLIPQGINVSESNSTAVGGLIVLNDIRSKAHAYVDQVTLTAGSLLVRATEQALMRATADAAFISSGGSSFGDIGGDSWAVGAVIATNTILSEATAEVLDSVVETGPPSTDTTGDVIVDAENLSVIDAVTKNASQSQGNTVGITLAFNTIGWKSQNFLFRAVDAIVGDPLIANAFDNQQPALVQARVVNSKVHADGDASVTGLNEAVINAEVTNEATSIVEMIEGSKSAAVGGVIASNMVLIQTRSSITLDLTGRTVHTPTDTDVDTLHELLVQVDPLHVYRWAGARGPPLASLADSSQNYATNSDWVWINSFSAGGSLTVSADETGVINADSSLIVLARAVSDGGISIAADLVTQILSDYTYTTNSGTQIVTPGQTVRVADGYANGGTPGSIYSFAGPKVHVDYVASLVPGQLRDVKHDETVQLPLAWTGAGVAGGTYKFLGTDVQGMGLDLATVDYTGALWQLVSSPIALGVGGLHRTPRGGTSCRSTPSTTRSASSRSRAHEHQRVGRGRASARSSSSTTSAAELRATSRSRRSAPAERRGDGARGRARSTRPTRAASSPRAAARSPPRRTATASPSPSTSSSTTNFVLSGAEAPSPTATSRRPTGDVTVDAENTSIIAADITSTTTSNGVSVGVTLAFNTVGWSSQNILFNIADAIAGDLIGHTIPVKATATISGSTISAGQRAEGDGRHRTRRSRPRSTRRPSRSRSPPRARHWPSPSTRSSR